MRSLGYDCTHAAAAYAVNRVGVQLTNASGCECLPPRIESCADAGVPGFESTIRSRMVSTLLGATEHV